MSNSKWRIKSHKILDNITPKNQSIKDVNFDAENGAIFSIIFNTNKILKSQYIAVQSAFL